MSRVGRMPVVLPQGVKVDVDGSHVRVKGPKGEMEREFSPTIGIAIEDGQLVVTRASEEPTQRALHGTTRALISNMITGVSTGFEKVLEVDGVGYRAELAGANLKLFVGYSHPVTYEPPDGINFEVETKTRQIKVKGFDKELVGQTASEIREIRPPEPYKGKGIRYAGERVRRKAGKSGKAKK